MNYVFDFVLIDKNSRRDYLSYKLKSQQVECRLYKQNIYFSKPRGSREVIVILVNNKRLE